MPVNQMYILDNQYLKTAIELGLVCLIGACWRLAPRPVWADSAPTFLGLTAGCPPRGRKSWLPRSAV